MKYRLARRQSRQEPHIAIEPATLCSTLERAMRCQKSFHWWLFGAILAVVLWVAGRLPAQTQEIRLRPGNYGIVEGGTETLPIDLEATENVTAFSVGCKSSSENLVVSEVQLSSGLLEKLGLAEDADLNDAPFIFINTDPAGGPGFVAAVILPGDREEAVFFEPGVHHLFDAVFKATGPAKEATVTLSDQLGDPPVDLVITVLTEKGEASRLFGEKLGKQGQSKSSVTVAFATDFRRGDVNANNNISLQDATAVLFYLFRENDLGPCPITANFDGSFGAGEPQEEDLADIDLSDPVLLLRFVFANGIPPVSPFESCGQSANPVSVDLLCREFDACGG